MKTGVNHCKKCGAITNKYDSFSRPQHKIKKCGKCGEQFMTQTNTIQKQIEEAVERLKKIRSTHGTYCGGWHDMDNVELDLCGECQAIKEFIDKKVEPFLTKQLNLIATKSAEESLKNWYFEGDELVITKGKWVIDRYKRKDYEN